MKKLLNRLWNVIRRSDDQQRLLIAFLASGEEELTLFGGKKLNREDAMDLVQELIPARIEMRGVSAIPLAAVCAAPHVSFDGWSEFFCNRVARRFDLGWVVARNFRDQDPHSIPGAIGRHVHVNRPMESAGPGRREHFTERAKDVHEQYLAAILEASGKGTSPIDLLLEFHSHHRTPYLEVATAGVEKELAEELVDAYDAYRGKVPVLPEMKIEPLHEVRLSADNTKKFGSLRPEITHRAFHMEIPREARRSDLIRVAMCKGIFRMTDVLLKRLVS